MLDLKTLEAVEKILRGNLLLYKRRLDQDFGGNTERITQLETQISETAFIINIINCDLKERIK